MDQIIEMLVLNIGVLEKMISVLYYVLILGLCLLIPAVAFVYSLCLASLIIGGLRTVKKIRNKKRLDTEVESFNTKT